MKHLTPKQIKQVNSLVRSMCANCDSEGRCILHPVELNKKGEYKHWGCPQLISYHLLCRYFDKSVLPLDKLLYEEIHNENKNTKKCERCEKPFVAKSNRAKYCEPCSVWINRMAAKESMRKKRKLEEKEKPC